MALRRWFRVALVLLPALIAAACVPETSAPKTSAPNTGNKVAPAVSLAPTATTTELSSPQPRSATYRCADGATMTIENLGSSVHVVEADGASEDLPASPANQNSRYGQAHDAIVIDGREALVMKGGKTPLTCTR
ncbi:hypothetical protein [Mesorhizobium sp.]|uniref:hypothetical protein n=1 Tax=Mesorhizobium sp. TaxID=1871066 RepID=UPI003BAD80E3